MDETAILARCLILRFVGRRRLGARGRRSRRSRSTRSSRTRIAVGIVVVDGSRGGGVSLIDLDCSDRPSNRGDENEGDDGGDDDDPSTTRRFGFGVDDGIVVVSAKQALSLRLGAHLALASTAAIQRIKVMEVLAVEQHPTLACGGGTSSECGHGVGGAVTVREGRPAEGRLRTIVMSMRSGRSQGSAAVVAPSATRVVLLGRLVVVVTCRGGVVAGVTARVRGVGGRRQRRRRGRFIRRATGAVARG